jgi:UDP-2,3-diacylglucosamine pyrophosphatase LpxH
MVLLNRFGIGFNNKFRQISHINCSKKLRYVSDIHIDKKNRHTNIDTLKSDKLVVVGDLGNPLHNSFYPYLEKLAKGCDKLYFVPGNHEYDIGPQYNKNQVKLFKPMITQMCKSISNVVLLDNEIVHLDNSTILAGTTLWSNPVLFDNILPKNNEYSDHIEEHKRCVEWIKKICIEYKDTQIIMASHFIPTFKLIEPKYMKLGLHRTSWFASNLEDLIRKPIIGWISGHSHSIIECEVNGIKCGINAANQDVNLIKTACIEY